jgi:DNA-binding LytR/AlgR family response regulator
MPSIKCLIVDDEPLARKLVAGHVEKLPGWEIIALCKNVVEAYEVLMKTSVDVLFLDINMPVVSGLDFYRSLKDPPLLVFTTAYPEYAIEGFELEAVDYLVKPVTFDRFLKTAERLHERLSIQSERRQTGTTPSGDYIFIKHAGKLVKIRFNEILYLEAQKDFVRFITAQAEILASMTMKEAEDILPHELFLRVHRSFIVSIAAVTALFGNTIEIGPHQVPVGANYKEDVMQRLK